ncbi:aspartic proteinase CDR1-like protein [Tanacetum coccineum]
MSRASHFSKKSGLIDADISNNFGEYLMSIDIGTPPVKVLRIVETASDLTWARCEPYESCYEQVGPILIPSNSSTYQPLSCQTKGYDALPASQHSCDSNNICRYKIGYGDGSHTTDDLAIDTFWFGQTSFKNVVFGCGHDNNGKFNKEGSGIIGLGGGPLSLVKQLENVIKGKFSYCLIPYFNDVTNQTSKMQFRDYAKVTRPNVVSTPLVKKDPSTYYYLTLERILSNRSGPDGFFQYCYKDLNMDTVPTVTFCFTDADVELPSVNTFLEVQKGISCLTIVPSTDIAIFGNLSQRNLLVEYDLSNRSGPDGFFQYCYKDLNMDTVPMVTFHFNNADVELPPVNTFLEVQKGISCLTIVPSTDIAIFGNLLARKFSLPKQWLTVIGGERED